MSDGRMIDLCAAEDVPAGQTLRVEAEGLAMAVYHVDGEFYVTDDHCTHGPGSLSEGWLSGYEIECDFHQGRFDVRTGEVVEPPPMVPVRTYPVVVREDRILVEVDMPAAAAEG